MDVVIFCGQSNMQGTTEARPIRKPVKNAWEFLLMGGRFIPLNHPVGETFADEMDSWLFEACGKTARLFLTLWKNTLNFVEKPLQFTLLVEIPL